MMKFTAGEILYLIATFLFGAVIMFLVLQQHIMPQQKKQWKFQSIDTMKYSRDLARQDQNNPQYAQEIDQQMTDIAATGANYVAIATPYDDEFLPVLEMWVRSARLHHLHVWFRGNWSGWEGWFGYGKIDPQDHINKTKQFILDNKDLFQDGDVFSSCPECENGKRFDLNTPDGVVAYRKFLIDEYATTKDSFKAIDKNVPSNFFSMNLDVAKTVMDKPTTASLGGLVVIDHYVLTPEQLTDDVSSLAVQTGGDVVLGEIGAPIPDIHGNMTEEQQSEWLDQSLQMLAGVQHLEGVSYWVNKGGSTALWRQDGSPKPAVAVLTRYFKGNP